MLELKVRDEGIGMSAEEANQVFDGFQVTRNAESKRLNPYGNGIGLAFCKQVCQSFDGDISVESVPGIGSEFTFSMKVMAVEEAEKEQEKEPQLHL